MDELSEYAERVGQEPPKGQKPDDVPPAEPGRGHGGPPFPPGSRGKPRVPRSHGF